MSDLAAAIQASAARLGVSPAHLATIISFETGGTFDPWKAGPTTKWGQHRGLIQWGEPQRAKYGVYQGMPNADQMKAVERYLVDAGVKPGTDLMNMYSAVNAGRVGLSHRSDTAAGGTWGTVADKVNYQMSGHAKKADDLLAGRAIGNYGTGGGPSGGRARLASRFSTAPQAEPPAPLPPDPVEGLLAQQFALEAERERQEEAAAVTARKTALFGALGPAFV